MQHLPLPTLSGSFAELTHFPHNLGWGAEPPRGPAFDGWEGFCTACATAALTCLL